MQSGRLLAAAVLLATFVAPGLARAAPARGTVSTPPLQTDALLGAAFEVGMRHWGALPCAGQIRVLAQRALAPGVTADSDAWVTFSSARGPNDLRAPAAGYHDCVISFSRARWPTAASMRADWPVLCATMAHEIGHLLGHAHDTTPGSVMAPVFVDYNNVPAGCWTVRLGGEPATLRARQDGQRPRAAAAASERRPSRP
ncbi:MAG: hypothetical protein NVS3B18_10350 [Candidatus Dormibacteria bacterium]